MIEPIGYEYEDLLLEFSPDGKYTKGYLTVTAGGETFGADVNITSLRARKAFIDEARDLYPEAFKDTPLEQALNDFAIQLRDRQLEAQAKAAEVAETDEVVTEIETLKEDLERYEAAMELLRSEDILEKAATDIMRLGHVGEWPNKKLAFVSSVSARAGCPIQPSTHAASAAGKNELWNKTLSLLPLKMIVRRSGMSAQALFRTGVDLRGSILYIQEVAGSEDANFSIRILQSDGRLEYEATEKMPDGTLQTIVHTTEGPTVVIQTTTRNHLHPENETRVLPIYIDESEGQTERITREALRRAAGIGPSEVEIDRIKNLWHDAIRLLEPSLESVVPFAERIEVPNKPLRLRRDVPRLLDLIKVIAWVHQHNRLRDDEGRIQATEADFYAAVDIAKASFESAWKTLTPSEEKVYKACTNYVPENLQRHGFKRSHVEKALVKMGEELSLTAIKDCLYTLSRNGYLDSDGKKGATGATYTVAKSENSIGSITLSPAIRLFAGLSPRSVSG